MDFEESVVYWNEWLRKNPRPPLTAEQERVVVEAFRDIEDLASPKPYSRPVSQSSARNDKPIDVHKARAQVIALDRAAAWELAAAEPERARAWLKNLSDTEDRYMQSRAETLPGQR